MLLKFRVRNFLSFRDIQTIRFTPEIYDRHDHTVNINGIPVLNSCYIFGPNAAGKSNLIKAMYYSRMLIVNGYYFSQNDNYHNQCFSSFIDENGSSYTKPTYFEYVFEISDVRYSYGFEIDLESKMYVSEWLYKMDGDNEICIFEIEYQDKKITSKISDIYKIPSYIFGKEPVLYILSCYPYFRGKQYESINTIYNWFVNRILIRTSKEYDELLKAPHDIIPKLKKVLKQLDTGIIDVIEEEFRNKEIPKNLIMSVLKNHIRHKWECEAVYSKLMGGDDYLILIHGNKNKRYWFIHYVGGSEKRFYEVRFLHHGGKNKYRIDEESLGTYRLIQLTSIIESINHLSHSLPDSNYTLILDEIECSIHTAAILSIINYFHNNCGKNQLIATTHESHIIDPKYAGHGEIWFIDTHTKENICSSYIYSLNSFKNLDKRYGMNYLQGRYSAVPIFRPLDMDE